MPETTSSKITDAIARKLKLHVEAIAGQIGERNVHDRYSALQETARYIEGELKSAGYDVLFDRFESRGRAVCNAYAEIPGSKSPGRILILGSHYDTVSGSPGANDNTSAIAANLLLAAELRNREVPCTVRFIFFVNEEAPYFMTQECGSAVHASLSREKGEHVAGMFSLETMGCFTDEPNSQSYPFTAPGFPTVGNFIAFIANENSAGLLDTFASAFKRATNFPVVPFVAPPTLHDACRSDHYAFWSAGIPALMITDTADFRYKHYHCASDTPDKLNYSALADVVVGIREVLTRFE